MDALPGTREDVIALFLGFRDVLSKLQDGNSHLLATLEQDVPLAGADIDLLTRWTALIRVVSAHVEMFTAGLDLAAAEARAGRSVENRATTASSKGEGEMTARMSRKQMEAIVEHLDHHRLTMTGIDAAMIDKLNSLPLSPEVDALFREYMAARNQCNAVTNTFLDAIMKGKTRNEAVAIAQFHHTPTPVGPSGRAN